MNSRGLYSSIIKFKVKYLHGGKYWTQKRSWLIHPWYHPNLQTNKQNIPYHSTAQQQQHFIGQCKRTTIATLLSQLLPTAFVFFYPSLFGVINTHSCPTFFFVHYRQKHNKQPTLFPPYITITVTARVAPKANRTAKPNARRTPTDDNTPALCYCYGYILIASTIMNNPVSPIHPTQVKPAQSKQIRRKQPRKKGRKTNRAQPKGFNTDVRRRRLKQLTQINSTNSFELHQKIINPTQSKPV